MILNKRHKFYVIKEDHLMVIVLTLQLKSLEFEPPKKNQIRRKLNQKCLLMEKDDQNIFKSPDNLVGNTA